MWKPTTNSSPPAVSTSSATAAGSAPPTSTGRQSERWIGCGSSTSHHGADERQRGHDVGRADGDRSADHDLAESLGALLGPTERPDAAHDHEPQSGADP